MGSYAELFVGSQEYSWKGYMPDVLAVLFDPYEYVSFPLDSEEGSDLESYCSHILATDCGKAQDRLAALGVDANYLKNLHASYFAFDSAGYRETLSYHCASYLDAKYAGLLNDQLARRVERMTDRFFSRMRVLSPEEEWALVLQRNARSGSKKDWLQYLDSLAQTPRKPEVFEAAADEKPSMLALTRKSLVSFLRRDPYAVMVEEDEMIAGLNTGSFDLELIYELGLAIFGSARTVPIELEFTDIVEGRPSFNSGEIASFLGEMKGYIRQRHRYLDTVVPRLDFPKRDDKHGLAPIGREAPVSSAEKGRILEGLVADALRAEPGFVVRERHRGGDEEIDVVVLNRIDDPFWLALQSPLLLFECKNRRRKVCAMELRDFEMKVRNCGPLCRLGVIISAGGFTRECKSASKRYSRDSYRIVFADKNDLVRALSGTTTTKQWIEDLILDQI